MLTVRGPLVGVEYSTSRQGVHRVLLLQRIVIRFHPQGSQRLIGAAALCPPSRIHVARSGMVSELYRDDISGCFICLPLVTARTPSGLCQEMCMLTSCPTKVKQVVIGGCQDNVFSCSERPPLHASDHSYPLSHYLIDHLLEGTRVERVPCL
jgi:hypothetical protein